MGGYKFRGPVGTSQNSLRIDSGTLCVGESCAPTPVGYGGDLANAEERPQIILAYNSDGHQYLSIKAIDAALKKLPPDLGWIRHFLIDTVIPSVYRDVEDIWTLAHWRNTTQKHHFMRAKSQTKENAYRDNVGWILQNAYKASFNLRRVWREQLGYYDPLFVNGPLGTAFHALQDSFTEGHASRRKSGDIYVITEIHVYDTTNKKTHSELDKHWKGPLGKEAITACRELTKIIVFAALQTSEFQFQQKWKSLWSTFEDTFLATTIGKTVIV